MSESTPETTHTAEPAEGAEDPGQESGGRTPHPQEPAEGAETPGIDPDSRVTGV